MTHNHSQSLVVHINHADRKHPGSSLGMFRKHSEHTELKRQQQRSLTGYCSNPYVRDQPNCNTSYLIVVGFEKCMILHKAPPLEWQKEQQNANVPRHIKNACNLLADFLQSLVSVCIVWESLKLRLFSSPCCMTVLGQSWTLSSCQQANQAHTHSRI